MDMAPQTGRHSGNGDFKNSAEGIPRLLLLFHQFWPLLGVETAADLRHLASDINAKFSQHLFGDGADRDPRRCLASRGPLEDIPGIFLVIFQNTGQIGMTVTKGGYFFVKKLFALVGDF